MMWRILVNHALAKRTDKRHAGLVPLTLSEAEQVAAGLDADVVRVHEALLAFAQHDETRGQDRGAEVLWGLELERDCRGAFLSPQHRQARLGAGPRLAAPRAGRRGLRRTW